MFNKKTKEIYPFRTDNAIKEPKDVNAMPHVTLITVYKEKFSHSPALSSNRDSLANVEKVVKPPQKPTVKNMRTSADKFSQRADHPINSPIIKHSDKLTAKVAHGNALPA